MVTIPIEPKKRPSDFILNEDEAIASLEAINNKVNTTLNNLTIDYNNFKVRIEKELQDTVVNLKLDDAKTLQSHPASDFVLKTQMPTSLPANGGNANTVNNKKVEMSIYTNPSGFGVSRTDTADTIWQAIPNGSIYVDMVQNLTDTSWNFPSGVSNEYTIYIMKMSNHRLAGIYLYPKTGGDIYCGFVTQDGNFLRNWRKICDGGDANTLNGKSVSDFVLTKNLPTSLPANGGNADTLQSHPASDFVLKTQMPTSLPANGGNANTVNNKKVEMSIYTTVTKFGVNWTDPADTIWKAIPDSSILCCPVSGFTDKSWNFPANINQHSILIIKISNNRLAGIYLYPKTGGDIYWANVASDGTYAGNWQKICDNGNAKTLNGKSASEFITFNGTSTLKSSIDSCTTIGTYYTDTKYTLGLPSGSPKYGILDVRSYANIYFQTVTFSDGKVIKRTGTLSDDTVTWSDWGNIADGGNASTVNGVKLMVGTREPQCEEPNALAYVPEGAWYGQY